MKFAAALIISAAALVSAGKYHGGKNETHYTTEIVTEYTTFCPEPTTITDGDKTYTVTEPTTITITHCPGGCTIEKPIWSSSVVECHDCHAPTANATATYHPTGSVPEPTPSDEPVPAGAAKLAGAGLAAFVGVVAFAL